MRRRIRRPSMPRFRRAFFATALGTTLAVAATLASLSTAFADGWSGALTLPGPLQNQVALTDGTYLYIAGGASSGPKSGVYSSLIGTGGTLGPWQTLHSLPQPLYNHAGVLQSGFAVILGGENANGPQATVYSAPIQAGGKIGNWSSTTALPAGIYDEGAVASGGFIWSIGGFFAGDVPQSTVYSAAQSGGTVGNWTAQTPLPVALGEVGTVTANGYIYVLGGHAASGAPVNTVYAAKIGANGAIGNWASLTALPQARKDLGVAVSPDGYLWATGGYNSSNHATNTVYRAPLNADGTIGTWLSLTPLPASVAEHTLTVAQSDLFVAGNKIGARTASAKIYDAPYAGPWLMLSKYSAAPGATVKVSGTGYTPGETVSISFNNGTATATATADATGSFGINGSPGASFVVPSTTAPGSYPVVGTGSTSSKSGQATLSVS